MGHFFEQVKQKWMANVKDEYLKESMKWHFETRVVIMM